MAVYRARVTIDLMYKADKPLTGVLLTRITNRMGTYARTGAVEGLEDKIEPLFGEEYRRQVSHHHDASGGPCSTCVAAATDGLGHVS